MVAKKYKQNQMPHQVSVETLPNGYAITIDRNEYMCFTVEQLVGEVFVRLALGELDYMNKDTITAVLETAARWKDVREAMMANAELIATARRAQINENVALRGQVKSNEKAEKLQRENERLWKESTTQRMEIEQLKLKLKKFDTCLVGGDIKPKRSRR